ncbi:MAG TPA: hypothetical protein VIZ68_05240 [Thermoplasmata archaeon]
MAPPKEPEPALVAPGIGASNSILRPATAGPRSSRRHRNRPYSHVHLEVDLAPSLPDPPGEALRERWARFLAEGKVVERGTLILMAAATLHALASRRFRRVDHWEVSPGGWLPPPRPGEGPGAEGPVGHLLDALESGAWSSAGGARSFSARLSDLSGGRVDVIVRRVHRGRRHALSLDLWGSWTKETVDDLVGSISKRLPVVRSTMTKFQYA